MKASITVVPGMKFGKWTTLECIDSPKNHGFVWMCQCECGQIHPVNSHALRQGTSTQCLTCGTKAGKKKLEKLDIAPGMHFGKWTVMSRAPNQKHRGVYWLCLCDCGEKGTVSGSELRSGNSPQCRKCRNRKNAGKGRAIGQAAANQVLLVMKNDAKRRGIAWELSDNRAFEIMQLPCHYCGTPPQNKKRGYPDRGDFVYGGIDRYENKLGYVNGNCVPSCWPCNEWKKNRTAQAFREHVERIARHQA